MDLAKFLNDRLDEDTATADGLIEQYAAMGSNIEGADRIRLHIVLRMTAICMLREVGTKRKILAEYERAWNIGPPGIILTLENVLRITAGVYSDHEDYDPAWKE